MADKPTTPESDRPSQDRTIQTDQHYFERVEGDVYIQGTEPRQEVPGPQLDGTELRKYCQKIEALHERIPLMGFRTALRVPIRIEDIYVPLRAMIDERLTGPACFADAEDAEKALEKALQAGRGGREISLPDALKEAEQRDCRGIVLLSDPGSGKTTHLKRVLLWCLRGGLAELGLPQDMIPVFLPLRELQDVTKDLDDFIQDQLCQPHLATPAGFGRRLLERGNLVFLLDGLDEVADMSFRKQISRWIGRAMTIHQSCRFVVTCRFAGYTDETRLDEDFLEMHIRPMTSEQAEAFVRNWYRIVETSHSKDREQAEIIATEKANELIERLRQPDFRARWVFELTRNPLLLTNICLVHLSRGNLPHTRAALYDECIDVLLERWRGAKKGIQTRFSSQTGRKVLQPAAYWLHQEEGRTRATAEELATVIAPALKTTEWGQRDDVGEPRLPVDLQKSCVDLLASLPGLHHRDAFLALLNSAGLDQELHQRISIDAPSVQFFQALIPTLFKYGTLEDGRNALKAVLEAAKAYGGQEKRKFCQRLIQEVDVVLSGKEKHASPARDFLRAVRDDSGLLTGWDQEHYGFMHLGFQEYLTAQEIRNQAYSDSSVLQRLASKFGESWWQEVILLLLALDNPSVFKPFMREVLKQPGVADYQPLITMCLDDAAEKSLQPFLDLLAVEPGQDQDLWNRQFLALQLVARMDAQAVEELFPTLRTHPSPQIRQWLQEQIRQARQNVIYAERGGYELVFIPGGVFMMGSPETEEGRYDDETLHQVQLTDFYMGRYPVTNEEYGRFLADNPDVEEPQYWGDRNFNQPNQPVVGVSWHEAKKYAEWAGLSLPTEAQWEYACRAGTSTRYYTGDSESDLDRVGWYDGNSGGKLHPVGEKEPNAFGLYDMHGNVWEWCQDSCDYDSDKKRIVTDTYKDGVVDPVCTSGSFRVFRGGGWGSDARDCRSAIRYRWQHPGARSVGSGLRLLRT
jgi:formylglycine-generating enzyme required for sulfatase activity